MVDDRMSLVLGGHVDVGTVILAVALGKRFRVVAFDSRTTEATLEPLEPVEIEIKRLAYDERNLFPPPRSKYLPGNPQPWKRR